MKKGKQMQKRLAVGVLTVLIAAFTHAKAEAQSGYIGEKKNQAAPLMPSSTMPPALPPQAYKIINNALPEGAQKMTPPPVQQVQSQPMNTAQQMNQGQANAPMTPVINPANTGYPVPSADAGTQAPSAVNAGAGAVNGVSSAPAEVKADPCKAFRTQQGYQACQNQYAKIERMKAAKADRDGAAAAKAAPKADEKAKADEGKAETASSSGTEGVTDAQIEAAVRALAERTAAAAKPDQPQAKDAGTAASKKP
jgi:hypothetical protein